MLYLLSLFLLPPLLAFGVYHLALWFDLLGINGRAFWRRVALASALTHLLLAAGFFAFSYMDYRGTPETLQGAASFEMFLFNRSEFWRVLVLFDTLPAVILIGFFSVLDRAGMGFGPVLVFTALVVFTAGTFQWYWVGGGLGAAFERLWAGLKSKDDDDEPDWL